MTTQASAPPSTKSQALRSYDVADFPALTGLEEEWRFTPLKRLRGLVGGDGSRSQRGARRAELESSEAQAATGTVRHEHGDLPEGVTVGRIGSDDPRVGSVLTPVDRVSALAYGEAGQALLVQVARDAVVAEPVSLRVVGESAEGLAFGHTFVEVGRFAEVTLVVEHVGSATLADNVEVAVADGAKLTLVTVADWADDAVQAQHLRVRLGRDAKVVHVQVSLGGDLVRQYTSVEYTDRGGEAELYGLYFADSGQHLEHRQLVDHTVPDCRSYVGYRGALQGESARTVWVGDVLIRAEATGTDTYEINRNLLLTDGARADSVPNLEIETGEIAGAGHASATGRFDDEQLFYLMARGIPESEARRLVVRGFFAELINKIPVESLRERLGDAIEARLTKAGA
ncbi:iron-regulated ABC transporter permease protein SufD [Micromonospora sp. M71_S20]|uniref:Fe-S cluster assembly protein SufD n=1 Tax=Micromonospora sp. M71_S20 TaxID=592872 RepID=UPI000EB23640|nr:Fe-S cluster assembly protein SufD [Micromonospora sp. M71_S20]RLK12479.1 iron-regulated ABC transporter permease protein SufD [Micromonospora sp. M71_S20]